MRKTVSMTREEVLKLGNGLLTMVGLKGTDFNFKLLATQKNLANAVKDINKVNWDISNGEGLEAFNLARVALCEELCVKGEDGKPALIMRDGQQTYDIEDTEENNDKFNKLSVKHGKALDKRDENIELYKSMLEEEVEVELHMLDKDKLPEDLTGVQIEVLSTLLEED